MSGLDSTIITTALPAITSDLHGINLIGWVIAVYLLGLAVTTPLWSKLGEHIGNKTAYQLATIFFVIGSLLEGLAPNMVFLIAARAVMGIGGGGMTSIPYIIYAKLYQDPKQRTKIFGFVTAAFSFATIIGPLFGGWIVDNFSWHWVFYVNVPLGLLSIAIIQVFFKTPAHEETASQPVDYLGGLLLSAGLICLLIGIEMIGTVAPLLVILTLLAALLFLAALIYVERLAVDPIIPGSLFKNAHLLVDFALFALIWGAFSGFNTYVPMWAQGIMGTSAVIGGVTQIPGAVTNFIGSERVVALRAKMTTQTVIGIGIVSIMIAFVVMVSLSQTMPYWLLLVAGIFEGFGVGICFNVLQIQVQQNADSQDVAAATSFSYLVRMLSQTFMASILSLILNQALYHGVATSHGTITMKMMNQLSDASSVKTLPQRLIPAMRTILHSGLHNIMVTSLVVLVVAFLINAWSKRRFAAQN
ncbi:MFS transporter [Levilactobacillus bambusae]|uniref:MFS transporter n=2 Tax=Levilactobacillus bambusae TaxID=2024736 RepID=A0A2V1N3S8_9LACO|nr:MFS transporter [Levilactobacillus bambusae]